MGQELPNKIRIPRLQRDYVQGLDPSVIIPFVEALLGKADIHLNYIYGPQPSPEMGFEPVDGQQRLTTLWLLRLCLSKVAGCPFFDVLSYTAREYADDFCRCLMSEKTVSEALNPKKAPWYIKAWDKDTSVKAMIATIGVIRDRIPQRPEDAAALLDNLKERMKYCLLPLGDDINEDIYIKMNRRGLPLTRFEILKSWLDERADAEWKQKMDGCWSEMAWDLIEKPSSEELMNLPDEGIFLTTDDLMLSVLYCFVHIYWAKNGSEAFLEKVIEEIKKHTQDDNNIEEEKKQKIADIRATLSMDQDADIYSHVMGVLANPKDKKRFDLYQLDKTPLFTKESMEFIKVRMNRLASVYAKIGDSNVFFGSKEENQHVVDYLISQNTYRAKAILYAATVDFGEEHDDYCEWLRRTRNLLFNTEISLDNFSQVCAGIDQLQEYAHKVSLSSIFSAKDEEGKLKYPLYGFTQKQLQEEARKSLLSEEASTEVKKLENHPFFVGRVNFLFDFAGDNSTLEAMRPYLHYMGLIFGENSFAKGTGNPLRQAMLSFGWFGYQNGSNWDFLNAKEKKQDFIYDNKANESELRRPDGHNAVLRMAIEELYRTKGLNINDAEALRNALLEISRSRYSLISADDPRYYLDFMESWDYMGQHQLRRIEIQEDQDEQYEMILLNKKQMNGNHINLWVHRLYLDWPNEYKDFFSDCAYGLYQQEATCLWLDKEFRTQNDGLTEKMAIDILHAIGQRDRFKLAVFIRENIELTKRCFGALSEDLQNAQRYKWNDEDRFVSCSHFSREELIDEIKRLHNLLEQCFDLA